MFCQRQLVIALVAILLFASTVMSALGESPMGTPVHPLLGWTLDADGSLYILDATHTLWQLAPETLTPLRASQPLVPAVGSPSTSESCVVQITSNPSDERDPVTGISTTALFVSDREGFPRAYRIDLNYGMVSAYAKTDVPESHPALSATGSRLYATREENGVTDIYRVENGQYTRITTRDGFDGHPAGGPIRWEPELEVEAKPVK